MHSRGLKSGRETADTTLMGQEQTSVIDAQTTAVESTSPPAVRRRRRLGVAAAVVAVAAGAIVWITAGGDPASADRQAAGAARSSEAAPSTSDAAPSLPASPAATDPNAGATSPGSASSAGAGAAGAAAPAPLPAGWESRTFQGLTFAVPPGAQSADVLDPGNADAPPSFVWTGPAVGDGVNAQITVWIYTADKAPTLGTEYQPITVPGADQAHVRTGATGSEPPMTAADVHILSGGRYINLVGMFASGPAGEQTVRDLVASLSLS